jgi:uncharacterized OsmC-like protein
MTSTVLYQNDLRTSCVHVRSGSGFETDAPVDNNGKGERFSPTDLLATSLAACMVTVMGIKGGTMGVVLDEFKIDVVKVMRSEPRSVAAIQLTVHIPDALANVDEKTKQVLKNTAHTCPVIRSLHPDVQVDVDWGIWS